MCNSHMDRWIKGSEWIWKSSPTARAASCRRRRRSRSAMHHQRIAPAHLLKALLEDEQGMAAGLIAPRRRQRRGGAPRDRRAGRQNPRGHRQRRQRRRPRSTARPCACSTRPSRSRQKAGDSYVTVERMLLALALAKNTDAGKALAKAGLNGEVAQRRDQQAARRPHRRHPERRGPLRRAQEIRARPHRGGARGQARPGDRPRRGNPPHRSRSSPAAPRTIRC